MAIIEEPVRVFKTAWFAQAAHKARVDDDELCNAIRGVMNGQADDLGGGVFKKRLDKNRHRSIILAKRQRYWVFAYLFAKKDRANIEDAELKAFRKLPDLYAKNVTEEVELEIEAKELTEICNERS